MCGCGVVNGGGAERTRCDSFVERTKDVLKVSGAQVSPTEIENALLAYPEKLIADVTVAGVSGGRTSDEKVPRAWVVLSEEGHNCTYRRHQWAARCGRACGVHGEEDREPCVERSSR